MIEKDIVAGNCAIAEFMGGYRYPDIPEAKDIWHTEYGGIHVLNMKYDHSWNWLMPVVIKAIHLMSSDCCFMGDGYLKNGHFQFDLFSDQTNGLRSEGKVGDEIETVFNAMVEFIKGYNKTKSSA